jgi:hypothetical protein
VPDQPGEWKLIGRRNGLIVARYAIIYHVDHPARRVRVADIT